VASVFPLARTSAGSPFAAPETQDGKGDSRSDIYSLGAILYLLLAHYAPPSARRRAEGIAFSVLEQLELPPLYLFEDHCPEMLDLVVQRTLALEPDERYHTAFELVEALEAIESIYIQPD
jgi:serine/threonine protein kinase